MSNSTSLRWRPTWRGRSECGVALPGVLLLAAFLVGVTGWMVEQVTTDRGFGDAMEEEQAGRRLAEAGVQVVAMALTGVADWSQVTALAFVSPCPSAPGATIAIDPVVEGLALQRDTDAGARWGADTPQWQAIWTCHADGVLGRWPGRSAAPSVVVWAADEPEGDGAPWQNGNQQLLLAAVARTGRTGRSVVTAAIARAAPGAPVHLLAWRGSPEG